MTDRKALREALEPPFDAAELKRVAREYGGGIGGMVQACVVNIETAKTPKDAEVWLTCLDDLRRNIDGEFQRKIH